MTTGPITDLIIRLRDKLGHVTDHIEDEGDRRYFGSTNDADDLRELFQELDALVWKLEQPRLGTSFPGNETFDDEPGRA